MRKPRLYRKLPVTIEAMPFTLETKNDVAVWCGGRVQEEPKPSDPTDVYTYLEIPTLEGVMRAQLGDYVIRGMAGEFYPCKPDIFIATYAPVGMRHDQASQIR